MIKNLKPLLFLLIAAVFSGCTYFYDHISISGTTPGMDNGTVFIKDDAGKDIFGEHIINGKFDIREQKLTAPGYYRLVLNLTGAYRWYDIYLEPGTYTITCDPKDPGGYPKITSSSKLQNELSSYFPMEAAIKDANRKEVNRLIAEMNSDKANLLPHDQYDRLTDSLVAAQVKASAQDAEVWNKFITKYPNSEAIAHIMAMTPYETKPDVNYKIWQRFSEAAKNTDDGQEIGERLSHLLKMKPGAPAPELAGTTPDGKKVNFKDLHKKIFLVEFWRAGITLCRMRHQQLLAIYPGLADRGVEIVSISLDDKRDWWETAIKDDKMPWPQISDLKGLNSPNVNNWGITDVPALCLVDGNGRMIESGIEFKSAMFEINTYLDKHPN